uniref:Putative secreted protein n=1 Tax=Anopheles darlingi TaxID=43151 RepID=A0A2M4DQ89_ANODA
MFRLIIKCKLLAWLTASLNTLLTAMPRSNVKWGELLPLPGMRCIVLIPNLACRKLYVVTVEKIMYMQVQSNRKSEVVWIC